MYYKEKPQPTKEAIQAIKEADLILLSMGSLFTSIIPNLICGEIVDAIDNSKGKIMYACNMVTQPGETDDAKWASFQQVHEMIAATEICWIIAHQFLRQEADLRKRQSAQGNEINFG